MYSLVFFNAVRGSQAEAASQTPSLTSDVTPGQSRAPFCPSSAGIYRTQLLFIEPVHTWVAECVLEPLMPPPRCCISISCTQLSCLFTFTLHLPLPHPFFFHFRPPPLSHSSPFFSRQTMLFHSSGFVRHLPLCFTASCFHFLLFPFSSRTSFLPPFFFSNTPPDHITGRGSSQETVQTDAHISFNHIINAVCSDKAVDIKQLFMKRY